MFSVGSYNIQKPDENWHVRFPQLFENIQDAKLDIVALQEVSDSPADREVIKQRFEAMGYGFSGQTEKAGATSVAMIWKKERFELVKTFKGTYTDGANRKRCFSAVDLRDKTTQKIIRAASVHLYTAPRDGTPHLGIPQLQKFRDLLEKESADVSRLIIAGDFNADFDRGDDAHVLNVLQQKVPGSPFAYHTVEKDEARKKIATKGSSKIDWVFAGTKSDTGTKAPKVTHHPFTPRFTTASDHMIHAVDVHDENVPFVERVQNLRVAHDPQLAVRLAACFANRERVVRDDLIRAGLVTRDDCNQKTADWARAGLIVQNGRGRETFYTRGPQLANAPQAQEGQIAEQLAACFADRERIVRDDLIRARLVTRADCNQKTADWARAGLIVQNGRGRETFYTRGPQLANAPRQFVRRDEAGSLLNRILRAVQNIFITILQVLLIYPRPHREPNNYGFYPNHRQRRWRGEVG